MTSSDYRLIMQVIRHFDFEKLHRVMVFLNWKMLIAGGSLVVPTVFHLQQLAFRLLKDSLDYRKGDRCTIGTGPFEATCFKENGETSFRLQAVIEELQIDSEELVDWETCATAKGENETSV